MTARFIKRTLLGAASAAPAVIPAASALPNQVAGAAGAAGETQPLLQRASVVRVGAVNTPDYSGLLEDLISEFGRETGYEVQVTSGEDVYDHARNGAHDLIISHYGKEEVEPFVSDGLGFWPRTVFANQQALIGPPSDPAGVRGMNDAIGAYQKIASSGSPYVVNAQPGVAYLESILWHGAGRPNRGSWYLASGLRGDQAVAEAARQGAYVLWGAFPFLRARLQRPVELEPLVIGDSLLQRIMVTIVVNPAAFPEANVDGALAFERFLLSAAVQGRIRGLRFAGFDEPLWWPAARHNNPTVLPA